jgi:hypothetical protein
VSAEAVGLMRRLVMDIDKRWGDVATPDQVENVTAVLDPTPGDPLLHFWCEGRGMDKTTNAGGCGLSLLLTDAPPRARCYAYASDEDQAGILLTTIAGFVQRTGLSPLVEITSRTVTSRATGATLTIEPADSAGAFGTRPYFVIVDELAAWPESRNHARLWSAIVSAIPKVEGARLLVMSSAGSPGHPAHKRWTTALASPHWRTSLRPGPPPWWSPAATEAAREQLLPHEYERLIECRWTEGDDHLTTAEDVAACTGDYRVLEPARGARYMMALDIGTKRDRTVLGVAHLAHTPLGRVVVVDRMTVWSGTRLSPVRLGEVEEAVVATCRRYNRAKLVYDPYQAAQLSERIRSAGVRASEFTFTTASVNGIARALYGGLRDRSIMLPDDEELAEELASVRLVETGPGLVRLDHHHSQHDDRAVVVGMLTASLMDQPSGALKLTIPTGRIPSRRPPGPGPTEQRPPAVVPTGEPRPAPDGGWRPGSLRPPPGRYERRGRPW